MAPMSDKYILDDAGAPVRCTDLTEWTTWFENADDRRRLALDGFDDVTVSTIFLALDHNWGGGPPLVFETRVFGGPLNDEQERYSTRAEALAGHAAWVARAKGEDVASQRTRGA